MTERDVAQMDRVFIGDGEYVRWSAAVAAVQAANAEAARLRAALEAIAGSADDDDGWTSDGHERCTEAAAAALSQPMGRPTA